MSKASAILLQCRSGHDSEHANDHIANVPKQSVTAHQYTSILMSMGMTSLMNSTTRHTASFTRSSFAQPQLFSTSLWVASPGCALALQDCGDLILLEAGDAVDDLPQRVAAKSGTEVG